MSIAEDSVLDTLLVRPRAVWRGCGAEVQLNDPELRAAPAAFRTAVAISRRNWDFGSLTFVLPSGRELHIEGRAPGPAATLIVHDFRFVSRVLAVGRHRLRRRLHGRRMGHARPLRPCWKRSPPTSTGWRSWSRAIPSCGRSTSSPMCSTATAERGARRNILAHYDLGNAFYERWLDPGMTYSSARFERPGQPLGEAQRNKYASAGAPDRACGRTTTCWRSAAAGAASPNSRPARSGPRSPAVTISPAQYEFARKRLFDQGLAERADIRLIDYRDVEGRFDRVASIEMFEAVGEAYWPAYFAKVRDVLSPGGRAGLQIITIRDELFDVYRARSDFMRKYIFPGGMLPSETRLREETERAGLEWRAIVRFGQNYADTLAEWAASLRGRLGRHPRPRLRRALPAPVALLPQLLRGRLPHRAHQRGPAQPGPNVAFLFPAKSGGRGWWLTWRCAECRPSPRGRLSPTFPLLRRRRLAIEAAMTTSLSAPTSSRPSATRR